MTGTAGPAVPEDAARTMDESAARLLGVHAVVAVTGTCSAGRAAAGHRWWNRRPDGHLAVACARLKISLGRLLEVVASDQSSHCCIVAKWDLTSYSASPAAANASSQPRMGHPVPREGDR